MVFLPQAPDHREWTAVRHLPCCLCSAAVEVTKRIFHDFLSLSFAPDLLREHAGPTIEGSTRPDSQTGYHSAHAGIVRS
jgi:hypothetical protein